MKKSQLTSTFNGQVLFQNNKYSIEMCDVLHLNQTDKKQICVVANGINTNWIRPNSNIDLLYLDFYLPRHIINKTLTLIKKHKDILFYESLNQTPGC